MHKYSLKFAALMVGVLAATLPLTACGDDDDDDAPDAPSVSVSAPRPTKLMYGNHTLISISYDSYGRMTKFENVDSDGDGYAIEVSYSPFKYVNREVESNSTVATMTISDATFNSRGFITKAKVTDIYEGDKDTYSVAFGYDSDGHLTSLIADGERNNLTWTNGNLVNFGGEMVYAYSDQKNTAQNVCVTAYAGTMAEFWLTGLFGEVPANLPSKCEMVYDNEEALFAYTLNSDGSIKSETLTSYGDYAMTIDYVYGARSLDNAFSRPAGDVKSIKSKERISNPLRFLRK